LDSLLTFNTRDRSAAQLHGLWKTDRKTESCGPTGKLTGRRSHGKRRFRVPVLRKVGDEVADGETQILKVTSAGQLCQKFHGDPSSVDAK
jgi:hypothetical protein